MELERTPVISIRTGEAVKSVKELKQNIQDLKDKIIELRNAEQDCSKETLELQASQRELNAVNGLTKASTDAVAGSYADLLNQLKEARDAWKQIPQFIDGELNPAYTEATNKVRSLTEQVGQMEQSTGDWHRNVGNYQSAFDGLAGGAGKLAQGMTSIAGTFGIATQAGTPFAKAMERLKSIIGILNGASGILGIVRNTNNLTTANKANTTSTLTNTVAKGANTTATWSLRTAVEALKASLSMGLSTVLNVITVAVSTLIGLLPDLIDLFKKTGEEADDLGTKMANLYGTDQVRGVYDEQIHELELTIKEMKASGEETDKIREKEKELAELRANWWSKEAVRLQKQKAEAEQMLDNMDEEAEGYDELREKVQGLASDLQTAQTNAKNFNQEVVDMPRLWQAEDAGNARKEAEKRAEEARKRAEKQREQAQKDEAEADKTLLDLIRSQEQGAEKIQSKYAELFAKIEEYYRKGLYTQDEYNQATTILWKQQNDELRLYYKERYETEQKGWNNSSKVIRQQEDEYRDVYKGLAVTLRGTVDAEKALYEEESQIRKQRLEQDLESAREHLRSIVSEQDQSRMVLFDFQTATREDLISLYTEMLADEDEFAKKFPEPFITALKTMGPLALQYNSETADALKQHVDFLMRAYEQAVEEGDVDGAEAIRNALLGDPPIADDEELTRACNDFVARFKAKLDEAAKNQKPFYKFMNTYAEALSGLVGSIGDVWEELLNYQVKFGKKSREEAEKEFKWVKGVRVAEATINTLQGVTAGLKKGAPVGYIEAATTLAAGTAQILKILQTDFSGSGPDTNTSAPVAMQPTPYVPTVGLNSLDYSDAMAQADTRVYVLESDITDAQNKQKVRVEESTF